MTYITTSPAERSAITARDGVEKEWRWFAQVLFDAITADPDGLTGVSKRWGVKPSTLRGWMPRDCDTKGCPPFDRLAEEIAPRMSDEEFVALTRSLVIPRENKNPGTIARVVEALQAAARSERAAH